MFVYQSIKTILGCYKNADLTVYMGERYGIYTGTFNSICVAFGTIGKLGKINKKQANKY